MFQRKPAPEIGASNKINQQVELEKLFNKNQLIPRIRKEFTEFADFDFAGYITHVGVPIEFGIDLLTQMALHKRTTLSTLVGILRHHYAASPNAAQNTADMLLKCATADLVDWDPKLEQFIVKFTLSDDVQEELDRYQYPLPMVVEPKRVTRNTETGYILGGGSLILRKNHHDQDICLDHINRVNKIKFAIDHDVVRMVKNKWRNLDKPKSGETKADFQRRQKAFEKYDRSAKEVIGLITKDHDHFYFTHKVDKRGRTYCQGYHTNYQGNPWSKAILVLADKEVIDG